MHTCPGEHTSPWKQHRPTRGDLQIQQTLKRGTKRFTQLPASLSDLDSSLRVFDRLWLTLDLRGCQFVKYPKRGGTSLQSSATPRLPQASLLHPHVQPCAAEHV